MDIIGYTLVIISGVVILALTYQIGVESERRESKLITSPEAFKILHFFMDVLPLESLDSVKNTDKKAIIEKLQTLRNYEIVELILSELEDVDFKPESSLHEANNESAYKTLYNFLTNFDNKVTKYFQVKYQKNTSSN